MADVVVSEDHPQTGQLVAGKYRLEEKLAEGGGGEVWQTRDAGGRSIALKFLKWSPLKSKLAAADRFKSEFTILKNLSHPHIGHIDDFGVDPATGLYFFTSEIFTAGDLRKIQGRPIVVIEELLLQSLRALEYLRNQGLLHLDLKPQNVMLRDASSNPSVAIIDFGLATFRPPDKPGGTPSFMAPEIVVRRLPELAKGVEWPAPDHRSDLYSLGVTFYSILTGIQPYRHTLPEGNRLDTQATMTAHLDEQRPAPPSAYRNDVPDYLDRIILKLMERHPDDRYPTAAVAAQAIQFRSPRRHSAETKQTLLAYLPKEGKLIGRGKEMEFLTQIIGDVAHGKPHTAPLLAIAGAAGVGKTRFLEAMKPIAQKHEMQVTMIDATSPETAPSLDDWLSHGSSTTPLVRALFIDHLEQLIPNHHVWTSAHEQLADGVRHLIRQLKLQARITDTQNERYVLAFVVNGDQRKLARILFDFDIDQGLCPVVTLHPFTADEVGAYLASLLGERPDQIFVDSLLAATGGNPRFLTDHLEQMIGRGQLFSLAGRPDAETLKTLGVDFATAKPPLSLRRAVLEKVQTLSPSTKKCAELLACFNGPTSAAKLAQCDSSRNAAIGLLELVDAGLVKRLHGEARYAFVNPLATRIIAGAIPSATRARYHDTIAAVLTKDPGPSPQIFDEHLAEGSDIKKRIEARRRLVHHALSLNHHLAAIEHLRALLKDLPKNAWKERAEFLIRLGQAYDRAHDTTSATAAFRSLLKLKALPSEQKLLQVRAYEQLGLLALRRRELGRARQWFERAKHFIGKNTTNAVWRLRLDNWLAAVDLRSGFAEKARRLYHHTWQQAKQKRYPHDLLDNNELGEATLTAGKSRDAIPILVRELNEAEMNQQPEQTASRHYLLGEAYRRDAIADYDAAVKHYEAGLKLAEDYRLLDLQIRLHNGSGSLASRRSNHAEAADHYRRALALAQQIESASVSVELMVNLGFVLSHLNRPSEAAEYLEAALDFAGGPKGEAGAFIRQKRPDILITLGDVLYRKHELGRAEEYLVGAIQYDRPGTLDPTMRYNLYGTLTDIYLAEGKRKEAEELLPSLKLISEKVPEARPHYEQIARQFNQK